MLRPSQQNGPARLKRKGSDNIEPFLAQSGPTRGAFLIARSIATDGGTKKRRSGGNTDQLNNEKADVEIAHGLGQYHVHEEGMQRHGCTEQGQDTELMRRVDLAIFGLRASYSIWTEEAEEEVEMLKLIAENPGNATFDTFEQFFEVIRISMLVPANVDNPDNTRMVDDDYFNTSQQLRFLATRLPNTLPITSDRSMFISCGRLYY